MNSLKLYCIQNEYIEYLRKFDSKVPYNKNKTRPYIGIVYVYHNITYFAPLASPKEKHKNISEKAVDVFKIQNGELGIVNLNNMIPAPMEVLIEILPMIKDVKYKILLEKQLTFLNNNKRKLLQKVNNFQKRNRKEHLSENIMKRCCDFKLLEQKFQEWNTSCRYIPNSLRKK